MSEEQKKTGPNDAMVGVLYHAGKNSLTVEQRLKILCDTSEPVVSTVDPAGNVIAHADLTTQIREAAPRPLVRREDLKLARVQDLVQHVLRFKQPGTVVFAARPQKCLPGRFTAVLDYSASRAPQDLGWNRERATIGVALSADANKWNESTFTQAEFARLVRDWVTKISPSADCPDATGNMLLTMAYDLEVTDRSVSKITRDRNSGTWNVELKGETTTSTTIYPSFHVDLSLIEGRSPQTVEVRCELYKVSGTQYGFRTHIARLEELVQAEFDTMCKEIAAEAAVPVWQGTAPGVVPTSD